MNPTNYRILGEDINSFSVDYTMNEVLNIWPWDGATQVSRPTGITSDPNGKLLYFDCSVDGESARLFFRGDRLDNGDVIGVNVCMFKHDGTLIKKSPLIRDDDTSTCYDGVDLISLLDLKVSGEDKGTPSYGNSFETNGSSIKSLFNKFYYFGEITQSFKSNGNTVDFAPFGTRPSFEHSYSYGPGDYTLNSERFGANFFSKPLKAVILLFCGGGGGGRGGAAGVKAGGGGGGALAYYVLNVRDYSFKIHIGSGGNGGTGGWAGQSGSPGSESYLEYYTTDPDNSTRIITLNGGGGGAENGGPAGGIVIGPNTPSWDRTGSTPILEVPNFLIGGYGASDGNSGGSITAQYQAGSGTSCYYYLYRRGGTGVANQGGGGASIGIGGDSAPDTAGADGNPGTLGSGGGGAASALFGGGDGGRGGDGIAYVFY